MQHGKDERDGEYPVEGGVRVGPDTGQQVSKHVNKHLPVVVVGEGEGQLQGRTPAGPDGSQESNNGCQRVDQKQNQLRID